MREKRTANKSIALDAAESLRLTIYFMPKMRYARHHVFKVVIVYSGKSAIFSTL